MNNFAIKQAVALPITAIVCLIIVGLAVPGYSSLSQQLSELGLLGGPVATIQRILSIISGASLVLFSFGLVSRPSGKLIFTALSAFLFGVSMISNGIFTTGSPLHGLYGIGIFTVLAPAFFVVEFRHPRGFPAIGLLSISMVIIQVLYLWLLLSGSDPVAFRGLTQRLASILMFGWYSVASYALLRSNAVVSVKSAKASPG